MSRLIKSQYVNPHEDEKKVIKLQPVFIPSIGEEVSPELTLLRANQEAERILADAKEQKERVTDEAKAMLQQVQDQISELKAEWELEKKFLMEAAQQEGFQVGLQQGEQAAKQEYSTLITEANQIVEQAKVSYTEQLEQAEETILKLGLKVADKILKVHLDETREDFIQVVKQAIKEVKDYADVNIIVHPSVYELVYAQIDELKALFNGDKSLYIYSNEELSNYGCLIESSFGRIDASIDSQLNELKVKLLELIEEE
ncbi:flagellar assembly protein FliH [Bacillus pinisoli]|uniref:flagellar assembly protein FliH n=1 Tax=Bacillus pinisoli TaxID=2901866 RepID=UPI001FF28575|nr:flagellar assembly protein FliH [Bacillus pinisoli]